jgi:hypothetical protein
VEKDILERYNFFLKSEFLNSKDKLNLECVDCHTENKYSYNELRNLNKRCINCFNDKCSLGERKIRDFLFENGIPFDIEKTFEGLVYKSNLRFDFFLPEQNIAIEFDGVQHFKENNFFRSTLEEIKCRDNIKNKWCDKNNIDLLRISYKDINKIDSIIKNKLNQKLMESRMR